MSRDTAMPQAARAAHEPNPQAVSAVPVGIADAGGPCQATDSAELRRQIMDSNVPKNEREWWASRTIAELLAALETARGNLTNISIGAVSGDTKAQLRQVTDRAAERIDAAISKARTVEAGQ